jgi:hypothetical protein
VHTTAGDFRSEDGFTPQLQMVADLTLMSETFLCRTQNEKYDGSVYEATFPINHAALGCGSLKLVNGAIVLYDEF